MARLLAALILLASAAAAQTAGDLAVVGFRSDNPDEFAFVALAPIAGGTEIAFTDNGWQASGSFRANEGTYRYTAPVGGLAPGAVVAVTEPAGTLTYVGRGGGQALFVFDRGHGGADRLAVTVDATPVFDSEAGAYVEYARFKAALTERYGPPVLDEEPRPGAPATVDTVWEPGDGLRAVELTLETVPKEGGDWAYFYVRVVGPAQWAQ